MANGNAPKRQRLLSRPGFMGCRGRVGLGDMPEEILVLIFSFLRPPFLRPLRRVCRSFRQASVEHMTGLRLADGNRGSLSDALRVFPKISALTIQSRFPASSEAWPVSVSRLKSLVVHRSAMDGALRMTELFSHLGGLTSLTFLDTWDSPCFKTWSMQDIVAQCPALRTLELKYRFLTLDPNCFTCIMRLSALEQLTFNVVRPMLPHLASLPHLRALATVFLDRSDDYAALAALTQLTSLGGCMRVSQWFGCLQGLTGLKRVSVSFPCGGEVTDVLRPLLQQLPTSLEGLCFRHYHGGVYAEDLRIFSGMTRLDRLEIGCTSPSASYGSGFWSLGPSNPWCERLVGLRHLALVGQPLGAPNVRLLPQNLTALEHLRLRLRLFDDVHHLASLTRLTLLHLYKEGRGAPSVQALGPPRFVTALQHLRHLSLYWEIRPGEERETVRCLAALVELERLHVTLEPLERGPASRRLSRDVGAAAPRGPAGAAYLRHHALKKFQVSKPHRKQQKLGVQVLQPLVRRGLLQELHVAGGLMVDKQTWESIKSYGQGSGCLC